jgi:hypothetical protein
MRIFLPTFSTEHQEDTTTKHAADEQSFVTRNLACLQLSQQGTLEDKSPELQENHDESLQKGSSASIVRNIVKAKSKHPQRPGRQRSSKSYSSRYYLPTSFPVPNINLSKPQRNLWMKVHDDPLVENDEDSEADVLLLGES